jgi:hypothetical protein
MLLNFEHAASIIAAVRLAREDITTPRPRLMNVFKFDQYFGSERGYNTEMNKTDQSYHIEVLANLMYLVKMESEDPYKVRKFAEVATLHIKAIEELFRAIK